MVEPLTAAATAGVVMNYVLPAIRDLGEKVLEASEVSVSNAVSASASGCCTHCSTDGLRPTSRAGKSSRSGKGLSGACSPLRGTRLSKRQRASWKARSRTSKRHLRRPCGRGTGQVTSVVTIPERSSPATATASRTGRGHDWLLAESCGYDPESKFWLANFVLNSGLGANFNPPGNAYAYNYLRRAVAAFSEHEEARRATLGFLSSGRQSLSRYAAATLHWEFFLGQSWHAYLLLRGLFKFLTRQDVPQVFVRGEGSVEERLNDLYNHMKHVESRIESGQMIEGATIRVWLTNEGLRGANALLTYDETGEILRDLANWATFLVARSRRRRWCRRTR